MFKIKSTIEVGKHQALRELGLIIKNKWTTDLKT